MRPGTDQNWVLTPKSKAQSAQSRMAGVTPELLEHRSREDSQSADARRARQQSAPESQAWKVQRQVSRKHEPVRVAQRACLAPLWVHAKDAVTPISGWSTST